MFRTRRFSFYKHYKLHLLWIKAKDYGLDSQKASQGLTSQGFLKYKQIINRYNLYLFIKQMETSIISLLLLRTNREASK